MRALGRSTFLFLCLAPFIALGQPAVLPEDGTDISDLGKIEEPKEEAKPQELPPLPKPKSVVGGERPPLPPPFRASLKTKPGRVAQIPVPEPEGVPNAESLRAHLEQRARYVRVQDSANADLELLLTREMRRAIGAKNVLVASASLIHEAKLHLKSGTTERAVHLAEAAVTLSPDMVAAHWMHIRALWAHDWTRLARVGSAAWRMTRAQLGQFRNQVPLLYSSLLFLGMALLVVVSVLAAVLLLKHLRYLAHDLGRPLPGIIGTGEIALLLLLLILAPAALGFGLHWTLGAALALTFGYQSTAERRASVTAAIFLGVLPGLMFLISPLVNFNGSLTDAMAEAIDETFVSSAEERLQRYVNGAGRNDAQTALILAHLKRSRGDLRGAEMEYRRALASDPSNTRARNNLGTVIYLLGNKELAKATFQQAGRKYAEPLLNLASINADQGKFESAKALLESARGIDPELTALYTSFDASTPTRQKLFDTRLDQGILWGHLWSFEPPVAMGVTEQLWAKIGAASPYWTAPLMTLIFLLIAVVSSKLILSIPCRKCGIPAARSAPASQCEQCQSVFLTAVAVEPSIRRAKESQVRAYQRRLRYSGRLLAFIPGGGHLYAGKPGRGMFLLLLLLIALLPALWPEQVAVHPWRAWIDGAGQKIQLSLAGGWALLLVLISVRKSWSR